MPSKIRWKGLRMKIIAWSFVPTVIILFAVALVIFIASQQVTETLALERDAAAHAHDGGALEAGGDRTVEVRMASTPTVVSPADPELLYWLELADKAGVGVSLEPGEAPAPLLSVADGAAGSLASGAAFRLNSLRNSSRAVMSVLSYWVTMGMVDQA